MTPLRERMVNDMTVRGLAENTKKSYLNSVSRLAHHYGRSPERISAQEVQDYLIFLHDQRGLSWQSCNCARHGIRFLYRITLGLPEPHFYLPGAKTPSTLPHILNHDELVRLFGVTTNRKHRALLMTAYAAGLRRASSADYRSVISTHSGCACASTRARAARTATSHSRPGCWRSFASTGAASENVPSGWLFPNQLLGRPLTRHGASHIYDRAKEKAGIDKPGGIHTLRHCYATGLLEAGVELHVIQRRLGHSSIRSTMRYLHLAHDKTTATPSPLDLLDFPRPAQA